GAPQIDEQRAAEPRARAEGGARRRRRHGVETAPGDEEREEQDAARRDAHREAAVPGPRRPRAREIVEVTEAVPPEHERDDGRDRREAEHGPSAPVPRAGAREQEPHPHADEARGPEAGPR